MFAGLMVACSPAVDASGGTEGSSTGEPGTSTTGPGPVPSTSGPVPSTSTAADTTTGQDLDDESSSGDDGAGFIPRPDAGGVPAGACLGRSAAGVLATIHAGDGELPDLICDPQPAPCETDIVGTWTVHDHCGFESLPNFFEQECPGSTLSVVATDVQGTRTFHQDMTFESELTLVLDLEVTLDTQACFGIDCELFGELVDQEDNNLAAACGVPEEGGACVCAMTITDQDGGEGTYELTPEGLVLTSGDNVSDPSPVCVSDGHLTVWDTLHESQYFEEVSCDEPSDCEDALGDLFEEWSCV